MTYYKMSSASFWDDVSSETLRWRNQAARSVGSEMASIALGPEDAELVPMVSLLRVKPGGLFWRHHHDCYRIEIVVQGSILTPEGDELTPGDVMVSNPGEAYGTNRAGPEGALTAEIFSSAYADTVFDGVPDDPELARQLARLTAFMDEHRAKRSIT